MNLYRTFYKGQTVDFSANTQLKARDMAVKHFKARKPWDVSAVLIEKDGQRITHDGASL